jgi:hypothetical protein
LINNNFEKTTAWGQASEFNNVVQNPRHDNSILIIDDSNRICSLIISNIVSCCVEAGYNCHIIQSSDLGMLETLPMDFGQASLLPPTQEMDETSNPKPAFMIYTANSPRHAIPVLNLPNLQRLTIISDIMMPADTQVGLIGMLSEMVHLKLPVNLLFTSSESQNREYVRALIRNGKAFFVEKGSEAWADLPYAIVNRNDQFNYKVIVSNDYDSGILHHHLRQNNPEPELAELPLSLRERVVNTLKNFPSNILKLFNPNIEEKRKH